MAGATDYDATRRPMVDLGDDSVEALKAGRAVARPAAADVDEADPAEGFALAAADLPDEELTAAVVPMRADEFRCSRCFLVHHRSRLVHRGDALEICPDCA